MTNLLMHILGRAAVREFTRATAVDKSAGEPVLSEEALVHAKTESSDCFIIHFYIAQRDTVVNCEVPDQIGKHLKKGWRGTLCHQGGKFFSFEHEGEMICTEASPPVGPFDPI